MDIELKIKEAEIYRSQGLYKESLIMYQDLQKASSEIDPDLSKTIKEKINLLKDQIEELATEDQELSSQDISKLRETWVADETVPEILSSVAAFKELGIFKEAVEEYAKLFSMDYPTAKIIPELTEALFQLHSPSRVIDHVEKMIQQLDLEDKKPDPLSNCSI